MGPGLAGLGGRAGSGGEAWQGPYPELAQGVDVLGLEQRVVVAVHQTLAVDHRRVVHQDRHVTHLMSEKQAGSIGEGLVHKTEHQTESNYMEMIKIVLKV